MLRHPALSTGDGVGEALHRAGVGRQVAAVGEIGGVGDLAALLTDGAEDVSLARLLHLCGGGLEQRHIIPTAAGEGTGHHVELHRGVHGHVLTGGQSVLAQDVLQRHLRHAPGPAADDGAAPQVLPAEGAVAAAHQKRAVPPGQLGEDHRRILLALLGHVDAGLRPRQPYVRLTGHHGGHDLVGAAAVAQLHRQALISEEPLTDGHILRRIEYGVGDFAEPHRSGLLRLGAARHRRKHHTHRQQAGKYLLHDCTPQVRFNIFSTRSTSWYITTAASARISTLVITRSMLNTCDP